MPNRTDCPRWCTHHNMESDEVTIAAHQHPLTTPEGVELFLWQDANGTETVLHIDARDVTMDSDTAAWLAREIRTGAKQLEEPADHPALPLVANPIATPKKLDHRRDDGLVDIYGHCTPWCFFPNEVGGQSHGASVDEHGPWCSHQAGCIEGRAADGRTVFGTVTLDKPYLHGTYNPHAVDRSTGSVIGLTLDGENEDAESYYYSAGEARRLIAILQWAVAELDGLAAPLPRRRAA